MDRKLSTDRKFRRIFTNILSIFAILAIALPVTSVAYAVSSSLFVGHWQATDVDGSDIRLAIGGPPSGPFRITWTENYVSFCNGEAGIVRGTGQINESDPYLLEADLHLDCFTTGASTDFQLAWRYHPVTATLSSRYDNGVVTIWRQPGRPQPPPPTLSLRVNYGQDWVESFYEGGHVAWVTVTESDGVTVKALAELVTEPKEYWGGETGFQSLDSAWFDAEGNQVEYPPDIQPYDWVFGWVDNGASAQVQIGDIGGMIDLAAGSIQGTIMAPWITDPVQVECLDWGSGGEQPFGNRDGGFVLTNGDDPYSCSWAGEWDIQAHQDVGVGYFGPDSHWVANAFFARNSRIVASEAGDWFWTTDFDPGTLNLFIYASASEGAELLWEGTGDADEAGFVSVGYDVHGQDLVAGNYLVISDGVNQKGLVLETITMEVFDTETEIMAGTAPAGREVTIVAGMEEAETQATIFVVADPENGAWMADFSTVSFDITEDMRPSSFAQIFDEDGDANEAGTPPAPRITEVWHRLNPDQSSPTPEHEVLVCERNGGWNCSYFKQAEPALGFEDPPASTTGSFSGQDVTAEWVCPGWFPSDMCDNLQFVASGVMSLSFSDGNELVVSQDLIVTNHGGEQILFTYWTEQGFYCPWYEDFGMALAANPFPTPFNGLDWPLMDCNQAP